MMYLLLKEYFLFYNLQLHHLRYRLLFLLILLLQLLLNKFH
jgi:hypothetical protein